MTRLFNYMNYGNQISIKSLGVAGLNLSQRNLEALGIYLSGGCGEGIKMLDISSNSFIYDRSLQFFRFFHNMKWIHELNFSNNSLTSQSNLKMTT